jgi:hypothetical protein
MLQVELGTTAQSDVQSVEYFSLGGDDNPPQTDDKVVVISIGSAFKIAIGVRDLIVTVMNPGERKLYSRDSGGAIAAFINLLTGGDIELNGNANTAVRFAALQTAFDELKGVVNSHTHLYNPGPGSPTATAAGTPQSAADISTAESDTVKLL